MSSDPSDLNSSEPVTSVFDVRSLNSLFREFLTKGVAETRGENESKQDGRFSSSSAYLDSTSPNGHAFNGTESGSIRPTRYFSNLNRCTPSDQR